MHPNSADIENEFAEISTEVAHLSNRLSRIDLLNLTTDDQERWESTLVCAAAVEKIYTGFERIMARLAAEIDRSPVAHAFGWHVALLKRMANPFHDVRAPVISHECYLALDQLRAFQHRQRNSYAGNLDFKRVVKQALNAVETFSTFKAEITARLAVSSLR